jgi:hypothetical protein
MTTGSQVKPLGGASVAVAVLVLVALVWLGTIAPTGTHPLFYFGLIMLGAGALSLLFAGVGGIAVRSRASGGQQLDPRFVAGIRRLVLAMWLCALVLDALGCLTVLVIANGRGAITPPGTPIVATAFFLAAVTVVAAGMTSVILRRLLPRH